MAHVTRNTYGKPDHNGSHLQVSVRLRTRISGIVHAVRSRTADDGYRRDYAGVLRDQWRLAAGIVVVCMAVAVAVALAQPSRYRATATLLVVPRPTASLAGTLARLASTQRVLTRAAGTSGVSAAGLRNSVHASVQHGDLIAVSATASTSIAAARRANAVAEALEIVRRDELKTANGRLDIVDPARPPNSRTSPRPWLNAAVGLLVGLLAATVVLLVRDRFDRRPRRPAELEHVWGLPLVAAMRNVGMNGRVPPDIVEGYRMLRANLFLRSGGDLPHALIVTSAVKNDGKSAIAANLARTLAASGYRVIAVSVDLHDSELQRHLGIEDASGIAELFAHDTHPRDVVTGSRSASRMLTERARSTCSPTARRRSRARQAS